MILKSGNKFLIFVQGNGVTPKAATGLSGAKEAAGATAELRNSRFLRSGVKRSGAKMHPETKNIFLQEKFFRKFFYFNGINWLIFSFCRNYQFLPCKISMLIIYVDFSDGICCIFWFV